MATFLEKLDILMKGQGLNKSKLSQISGVPYTTIDGFYKKGYENAQISTIRKIAQALDCSLDYLIEDEPQKTKQPAPDAGDRLSDAEVELFTEFRKLPDAQKSLAASLCAALIRELLRHHIAEAKTEVSSPVGSGR